jgi:ATP-dependent RNA helicase RhlE
VFTRTKHRAQRVAQQLARSGFRVTSLQGNLTQGQRQAALDGFRSGRFKIMVATDIAARGLDVLEISHVVNYDMPDDTDSYIHRVGRTGRVGKSGAAFTFVTAEDAPMIRHVEQVLKAPLEKRTVAGFDYQASPETVTPGHRPRRQFMSRPRTHRATFGRVAA